MSSTSWYRFVLPTELRNENGRILSGLDGARVHILRRGAVYLGSDGSQIIEPQATGILTLQDPGSLHAGDTIYVLPQSESESGPLYVTAPLSVDYDPMFDAITKTWSLQVTNIGTIPIPLNPMNVLVLAANNPSHYVQHSLDELGTDATTSPLVVTKRGRIETYIPLTRCDLRLTADTWTFPVYIPNVTVVPHSRVSVRDYGAIGNGVVDDSLAIQKALDYVGGVLGGGIVVFPAGVYRVTATLRVWSRTIITGDGMQNTIVKGGAAVTIFQALGGYDGVTEGGFRDYIHFRDLSINGGGLATRGIHLRAARLSGISNCRFEQLLGEHVFAEQVWDSYISNCFFTAGIYSSPSPFLHLDAGEGGYDNTNGIFVTNCRFGSFYSVPVYLHGRGYGARSVNLIYFIGCQWESAYMYSRLFRAEYATMLFLNSCSFAAQRASSDATYATVELSEASDVFITDCHSVYLTLWKLVGEPMTFPDGDESPSVSGGEFFLANNSQTTEITEFDGGVANQIVTIYFATGHTTIVHGGTLRLMGGESKTFLEGDVSKFIFSGFNWYEIGRCGSTELPFVNLHNVVGLSIKGGRIIKTDVADPPIVITAGESKGYSISGFNLIASGLAADESARWRPQPQYNLIRYEGAAVNSYKQNAVNDTLYLGAYGREPYITFERIDGNDTTTERWMLGRVTSDKSFRILHSKNEYGGTSDESEAVRLDSDNLSLICRGRVVGAGSTIAGAPLTFVDGDQTPSVDRGNVYRTANSSATSIYEIRDGAVGQMLTIVFGDNATHVVNGGSIKLAGGNDYSGKVYDTLTLICVAANEWVEVSRMVYT